MSKRRKIYDEEGDSEWMWISISLYMEGVFSSDHHTALRKDFDNLIGLKSACGKYRSILECCRVEFHRDYSMFSSTADERVVMWLSSSNQAPLDFPKHGTQKLGMDNNVYCINEWHWRGSANFDETTGDIGPKVTDETDPGGTCMWITSPRLFLHHYTHYTVSYPLEDWHGWMYRLRVRQIWIPHLTYASGILASRFVHDVVPDSEKH